MIITLIVSQTERLNKKEIGEYLGEGNELNIKVLKEFSLQHDFTGLTFDGALRFIFLPYDCLLLIINFSLLLIS